MVFDHFKPNGCYFCELQRAENCAGSNACHVKVGKVQDVVPNDWHLTLPEEQPDGVNKGPEIVVTINFWARIEANISKYLSEFLANRRQIIKHDIDVVTNRIEKNIDNQHSNTWKLEAQI